MNDRLHFLASFVLTSFVCVFGILNISFWIFVLVFDSSYSTLETGLKFAVPIGLGIAYLLRNAHRDVVPKEPDRSCGFSPLFDLAGSRTTLIAVVLVILFYGLAAIIFSQTITISYSVTWALACSVLAAVLIYGKPFRIEDRSGPTASFPLKQIQGGYLESLFFLLSLFLALYLTATTVRPDADDAYYLHLALSTLANPDLPVLAQDLLQNTGAQSLIHPSYKAVSYEVIIAFASGISGLDLMLLYYNIFPLLIVVVWACASLLMLRAFGLILPGTALLITTVLLVVWGGDPHAFGNFSFVRLFQGKAVLAMLAAPVIFSLTISYFERPDRYRWLLLFLGVCSLAGLTSSALFVIPAAIMLAALIGVSVYGLDRTRAVGIVTATLPVFVVLIAVLLLMSDSIISEVDSGAIEVSGEAFGGVGMKYIMLFATMALALTARQLSSAYSRLLLVTLACLGAFTIFPPAIFEWPARILDINLLSWRLHWCFPTVFILGVLGAASVQNFRFLNDQGRWSIRGMLPLAFFVVSAAAVVLLGTSTMAFSIYPPGNALQAKIDPTRYERAKIIASVIPSASFVAAGRADEFLPRLLPKSAYISVRHYLLPYQGFLGEEAYNKRAWLQEILTKGAAIEQDGKVLDASWAGNAAFDLGVTAIVLEVQSKPSDNKGDLFSSMLSAEFQIRGYRCDEVIPSDTIVCLMDVNKK